MKLKDRLQRLMTATDDLGDLGINQSKVDGYEKVLDQAIKAIAKDLEELVEDLDKEIIFGREIVRRAEIEQAIKEYVGDSNE